MPEETTTVCMTRNGYFLRRKCYENGVEMRDWEFNMLKVTLGKRMYPTGIKRVDDVITIWMVTLSMLVDVNMPMNLMGAGITAAPAVSPGIGRHFMFKEKIFSSITETIKNMINCETWVLLCTPYCLTIT